MRIVLSVIVYCVLLSVNGVNAQQLNFTKTDLGDSYQFDYQWLDINKNQRSLSFTLNKKTLFKKFRRFKEYNPKFATRYVQKNIKRSLQKQPLKGVLVNFDNSFENISLSGNNQEAIALAKQRIQQEEQTFFHQYLQSQYYHQFTDHNQNAGIKPDHIRIAHESAQLLAPAKEPIMAAVDVQNIRKVTDFTLSFVQNIPYSELISRTTSSGAGFNVPTKVIWENQGDCDSKMTLTIAILRALMPRITMAMIYIDQHAFIGIDTLPEGDDITITVNGQTFVLGDPTGPALMPLGKLSFDSEQAIHAGLYTAEVFDL
ncbi:hypothetical protein [Colwellia sp. MEBiC06753]